MEHAGVRRRGGHRRGWWALALVAAVLVGLVAMHGLGTHGVHSAGGAADPHPAPHAAPHAEPRAGVHSLASPVAPGGVRPAAHAEDPTAASSPDSSGAWLAGLCLALLVLGVLRLWGPRAQRRPWTLARRAALRRVAALRVTSQGPGPPSRAQLSVWRC